MSEGILLCIPIILSLHRDQALQGNLALKCSPHFLFYDEQNSIKVKCNGVAFGLQAYNKNCSDRVYSPRIACIYVYRTEMPHKLLI